MDRKHQDIGAAVKGDGSQGLTFSESLRALALFLLQTAALVGLFPAFFCTVSFIGAWTRDEVIARGYPPLPDGWEAGVRDHGEFYEWYTISEHPLWFAGCLVALLSCWLFLLISGFILPARRGELRRRPWWG